MQLKKTVLSEAMQTKPGKKELDDFSMLLYQEVKELEDIEGYFKSCRIMVMNVRDILKDMNYSVSPYSISKLEEASNGYLHELQLLWNVAPYPWHLRGTLHFKVSRTSFLADTQMRLEHFVQATSSGDVIFRKRFKEDLGVCHVG